MGTARPASQTHTYPEHRGFLGPFMRAHRSHATAEFHSGRPVGAAACGRESGRDPAEIVRGGAPGRGIREGDGADRGRADVIMRGLSSHASVGRAAPSNKLRNAMVTA